MAQKILSASSLAEVVEHSSISGKRWIQKRLPPRTSRAALGEFLLRNEALTLAKLDAKRFAHSPRLQQPWDESNKRFDMEHVDGESLAVLLNRGQLWTREARGNLLRALRDVVASLHELGVAHGELKPGNILIRKAAKLPRVKASDIVLIDFQTASFDRASAQAVHTRTRETFIGTYEYMAPEQAIFSRHLPSDWARGTVATDLWHFGTLAYSLCYRHPLVRVPLTLHDPKTSVVAEQANARVDVAEQVLEPFVDRLPSAVQRRWTPATQRLFGQLFQLDPRDRVMPSAADFQSALDLPELQLWGRESPTSHAIVCGEAFLAKRFAQPSTAEPVLAIGRPPRDGPAPVLAFENPRVSRGHVLVRLRGGAVRVVDDSANGTWVWTPGGATAAWLNGQEMPWRPGLEFALLRDDDSPRIWFDYAHPH